MKRQVLIIILVISSLTISAQSDYYTGYKKGFAKGCQCYDNIPYQVHMYSAGSYSEGYTDGTFAGRELLQKQKSEKRPSKYQNSYSSEPNYELLERSMRAKQEKLDDRRNEIRYLFENTMEILVASDSRKKGLSESQTKNVKDYMQLAETYLNYNLLDNKTFFEVKNWFLNKRKYYLTW